MDKGLFWITVALVGVLGVWATKFIAAQTNVQGLRSFAGQL